MSGGGRIDGWKAIAAYFKRDRSTVMRWARERQLPVHRLPGGKQGTVFALEDELAAWAFRHPEDAGGHAGEVAGSPDPAPNRSVKPGRSRRPLILGAAVAILLGLALWAWLATRPAAVRPRHAMPADPAVAALYLEARDSWARRTGPDTARAIDLYRQVIRRAPDFAPGYAGLADAWLTAREYGGAEDSAAFGAARDAAERAIRLDPDLPAAHRALGFIHYWWANDASAAIAAFDRALALDDTDAQTHFWYANLLAYIGKDAAAERHYARARLLSPGVQAIEVEYGCAQWLAGNDARALATLTALVRRYPNDPTARQCLAWVYIGTGDVAGYAREYAAIARLRGAPALTRNARDVSDALASGGPAAARAAILAYLRRELADGTRRQHETSSFFASALGDRAQLVAWLKAAVARDERWDGASITRRIATRWRGDREIESLLAKVRAPVPADPVPADPA